MSSKVKPYLSKRLQDKVPYPLHPLADLSSNFWSSDLGLPLVGVGLLYRQGYFPPTPQY